jgi:hypothetical protein
VAKNVGTFVSGTMSDVAIRRRGNLVKEPTKEPAQKSNQAI